MQGETRAGGVQLHFKDFAVRRAAGEKSSFQIVFSGAKIHVGKEWRVNAATPLHYCGGPLSILVG